MLNAFCKTEGENILEIAPSQLFFHNLLIFKLGESFERLRIICHVDNVAISTSTIFRDMRGHKKHRQSVISVWLNRCEIMRVSTQS